MPTYVGCPHCGATTIQGAKLCLKCGKDPSEPAQARALLDEFALMATMSDQQRLLFQSQMQTVRKDSTTAVLLALFLGGLGIHHFYMGNMLAGVLYLIFSWTFIPAFLGVIEAFTMPGRVRAYNQREAMRIAALVNALGTAPAPV